MRAPPDTTMSKASGPTNLANSHRTSIADLDLEGAPASHRHAVRALRARLSAEDCVSIDHVTSRGQVTRVFLAVEDDKNGLASVFDVRTALEPTGVERANIQFGILHCVVLDGNIGFQV